HKDDGKLICRLRAIDVGVERNTVVRLHRHIVLNDDVNGSRGRRGGLRAERLRPAGRTHTEDESECQYRERSSTTLSHALSLPPRCGREKAPHTVDARTKYPAERSRRPGSSSPLSLLSVQSGAEYTDTTQLMRVD